MTSNIYLNLEDGVSRIVAKLKKEKSSDITLVCPKKCILFNDRQNLAELKKEADILGKHISILTMDERGQQYATEAGFKLKMLPKSIGPSRFSDIKVPAKVPVEKVDSVPKQQEAVPAEEDGIMHTIEDAADAIKNAAKNFAAPVMASRVQEHAEDQESAAVDSKQEMVEDLYKNEPEPALVTVPEDTKPARSRQGRRPWGLILMLLLSAAVILAVIFYVLPRAEVYVYPRTEPITRDLLNINISPALQEPDVSKLHLPATKVVEVLEGTSSFQSQGKKDVGNKAAGKVRIFNFTGTPLNLKASTTVLTIGSKNYTLAQDISGLRPTTYKNAATREINEASLSDPVDVVAAAGGEQYNAPAGVRMEITNQVLGSRPQVVYAEVTSPILNGTSRFISFVAEQDLSAAQTQLAQKLVNDYKEKLKGQDLVLLDKSYVTETMEFAADKPVGTEVATFEGKMKVRLTGLVFDRSSMENMIHERISQTLANGRTLKIDTSRLEYTLVNADLNTNLAVLSAHFEGDAVMDINLGNVTPELVGKTKEQANEILRSKAEIDKVEMTLSPAWQSDFPWFASKIDVRVVK